MRIIKYILFFICILAASCFTNEAAIQNHIFEYEYNAYICCFEVHSPSQLIIIDQIAKQTNVNVYVISEELSAAGQTNYTFFQTSDRKKISAFPLPDTYRSISNGIITEFVRPLTDYPFVHENIRFFVENSGGNTQQFFDNVTKKIKMTSREQNYNYHNQLIKAVVLIWALCWGMIMFLAYYHVCSIRREISIRMCFGFSTSTLVLGNILLESTICTVLIFSQRLLLSVYSSFSSASNYVCYYSAAIMCAVFPYISLIRFDVKHIAQRNTGWKRLLYSSYILKFCSAAMIIISLSLFASVGLDAISTFRTSCSVLNLRTYDILQFHADPTSEHYQTYRAELDDAFAERQCQGDAYNAFYAQHRFEVMAIAHIDNKTIDLESGYEILYYNFKALSILDDILGKELGACPGYTIFLVPKPSSGISLKDRSAREKAMQNILAKFGGKPIDLKSITTIMYQKNVRAPYFETYDNSLIKYADNPYIVISRKPMSDYAAASSKLNMFDAVIAYPDQSNFLQSIDESLPYVQASSIDLDYSMNFLYAKSKRDLFSIFLLITLMIILQYVVTFSLVIFYHKINLKKIAILRTTGASFRAKYGNHLLITFLIYIIIGVVSFFILHNFIINWKLVMLLFICCCILDLICLIGIHFAQEKKNIVKILKGGFL